MTTSYLTIEKGGEGLYKDRRSKFFAFAFHVETEDQVKEILAELRKKYYDARHHCYAWRLGYNPVNTRANDDGEPSNSAGKPILNQIEKLDLTNTLVVVIRYFGGTLLGVGGLINAYRTATEACLNESVLAKKFVLHTYCLEFEYPLMNDVMRVVKDFQLETTDQVFELNCAITIHLKVSQESKVLKQIEKIRGCKCRRLEGINSISGK